MGVVFLTQMTRNWVVHLLCIVSPLPMEASCLFTRGLALGHTSASVLMRSSHFPLSGP